ncbi:hypothetical protein [Hymenobacter cellulosilyticus]|uniref:Uncharacterized protein n=1 Tax=Hymenobacter cellulosilyticus TaxID=2932248 RepID=A0A8T9Q675_9BACT|nr:hypothetical protein [Hymenobacter cellulosilyticus]UOQ73057.1 hypothetical protein MUN79_03525 [Hymenobacter cellulosilyticus]
MHSSLIIAPNSARPLTVNRLGYGTMRLTGPASGVSPPTGPRPWKS